MVVQLMEPQLASRKLMILTTLLDHDLGHEQQALDEFLAWELEVRLESSIVGGALGDEMKIAVISRKLPEVVRHYLQLRAADIGST